MGVFAFGAILGAVTILQRELPIQYQAIEPASAILHATPFDEAMVDAVRRMPTVASAEGRFRTVVRYLQGGKEWHYVVMSAPETSPHGACSLNASEPDSLGKIP